jgi:hypothetical protein
MQVLNHLGRQTKDTVPVAAVAASKQAMVTMESGDENWDIED